MDSFTVASFLHLMLRVCLVGALVTFVIAIGERAMGLNIRNAIDTLEDAAKLYISSGGERGTVWPLASLLIVSVMVLGYVLG